MSEKLKKSKELVESAAQSLGGLALGAMAIEYIRDSAGTGDKLLGASALTVGAIAMAKANSPAIRHIFTPENPPQSTE